MSIIALFLDRVDTTSVLLNYEVEFMKKHPTVASPADFELSDADYDEFKKAVLASGFSYDRLSEKYLKELERVAQFEGYYDDAKADFEALKKKLSHNLEIELDWPYNKEHIKQLIAFDIMAIYYYQKGAIEHSLRYDPQYKEAVRLLNAPDEYRALLTPKVKAENKKVDEKKADDKKAEKKAEKKRSKKTKK